MIHTGRLRERDLEREVVREPNRHRLVPHEDAKVARQETLGQLREMERRHVAAGSAPKAGRDRHHEPTVDHGCYRTMTPAERFGDRG
jgi:hypothetical protein